MTQDLVVGLTALSAYGVIFLVNVEFLRFAREKKIEGDTLLSIFQVMEYSLLDAILISLLKILIKTGLFPNLNPHLLVFALGGPVIFMKWIELIEEILPKLHKSKNGKNGTLIILTILGLYIPMSLIALAFQNIYPMVSMSVVYGALYVGVLFYKTLIK